MTASNAPSITTILHWIDGQHIAGGERSAPVFNPATGQSTQRVLLADRTTVEDAIASAQAAFPAWRATPPLKRARVMARLKTFLEEHADELCGLITAEHGKVLSDALGELQRGIENVEYASYAPELLKGEHSKNVGPSIDSWSEFQPLGVCAGITPFNFPIMVPLWMWPMAIACGNTFVLKPSERDPSSALRVAELALEAGLPAGVLNVVNGDKEAVDVLLTDPRVKAISFVGSTPIAETIYATGCAHGKRVQALGGAKNHAVVMPDADVANAVNALMGAAYGSCGERCMAIPQVVAVGDATADAVIAGLVAEIAKMKVGPGTQAGVTDPDQAVDFVTKTKVDALAIAMGTSHGAYKFSRKPDGAVLAMNVIEEIHRRLPNTHLVMHGSSSVPQDLQDVINQYGGKMPQTWGVPVEEIQRGINGVRKINIDTDNRMAITGAIRKVFAEKPGEFDPRAYLKPAKEAMRKVCIQRFNEFGAAGQAGRIKPLSTAQMAKRYTAGELDPTIGKARAAAAE